MVSKLNKKGNSELGMHALEFDDKNWNVFLVKKVVSATLIFIEK
jgi:hypothetical protein